MRAMVLAAGIGSRLEPLSNYIPKPLIRIGGRPVMEHILLLLKRYGFNEVISNTYHLAPSIEEYFSPEHLSPDLSGLSIEFRRETQLSGVAGGIRLCQDFLRSGTVCIIMGDALTDIELGSLYQTHLEAVSKGCIVSIAQMQVSDTSNFGVIVTDSAQRVIHFQEKPSQSEALSNWANTGIYFFEPEVYDHIPPASEAPVYDVAKDLFPDLLRKGKYLQAIPVAPDAYWADIGTPSQYLKSLRDIAEHKVKLQLKANIDPSASIDPSTILNGANEIAEGVQIEANARIDNSIIWQQAKIGRGVHLSHCIVGPHADIADGEEHSHKILA